MLSDTETYHQLGRYDLVDLKCDTCSKIYQKTKRAWYYTAHKRGIGLDFESKCYCSDLCRNNKYHFTRKQYNCLECNKEFEGFINQNPKFCGHSCAAKFNNRKKDGNKLVNCCDCNIEFSVWKCKKQNYFRCKTCIEQRAQKIKEEKNTNLKKYGINFTGHKTKQCKHCLNTFQAINMNNLFCNNICKINASKKYICICKGCNKAFNSERNHAKFCSNSCKSINLNLSSYAHKSGGRSRSKIELYLEEILQKDFPNIIFNFNDKKTIGYELDVYIPQLKIGIELNGIVHYEPIYGENTLIRVQNNDRRKMLICSEQGIELIVINMGKKGLSKSQREEIYKEIYSIIERNKNRLNISP